MKQSVVTVRLNGQPYQIGCGPGEEAHVEKLGRDVEEVVQELVSSVGQVGEARLLAMVSLIMADRANGEAKVDPKSEEGGKVSGEERSVEVLQEATKKISLLATKLASHTLKP